VVIWGRFAHTVFDRGKCSDCLGWRFWCSGKVKW